MNKEKIISMIGELSDANGASGFEDDVLKIIRCYGESYGVITEDSIRNLYLRRNGNSGKLMLQLDAHTDEVAFMVHHINDDGTLKFITLGGWVPFSVPSHAVRVHTAYGYIPGVVAAKPPHYMSEAEKNAAPKLTDMVIDVGAVSKEDAIKNFGIRIGEPVIPEAKFQYIKKHDLLFGKAFDDRIGCAVLLALMEEFNGKNLDVDVTCVFASQEEMGLRGSQVGTYSVKPDIAIVFEGCPADDTLNSSGIIQTAIKRGPMLRHIDAKMITNPRFQRFALDIADEFKIPVQEAVRTGGATNGGVIHISNQGVPVIVIGLPVRYIHTHYGFAVYEDFENAVKLGVAIIERLNKERIASF